jgi:hypothetical protein
MNSAANNRRVTSVSATIREWSDFALPCGAINPSECYAITNPLERQFRTTNGPVTTSELAAAAGNDGRPTAETRPLLPVTTS